MEYNIGDLVLFGPTVYVVIGMSNEPIAKFDDGSRHYELCLRLLNSQHPGDILYVNDAQIRKVEKEVLNNECEKEKILISTG